MRESIHEPRYEQIGELGRDGRAMFSRRSDGRIASVKASWFKPAPDGDGLMAASRTKAIRLDSLKWE